MCGRKISAAPDLQPFHAASARAAAAADTTAAADTKLAPWAAPCGAGAGAAPGDPAVVPESAAEAALAAEPEVTGAAAAPGELTGAVAVPVIELSLGPAAAESAVAGPGEAAGVRPEEGGRPVKKGANRVVKTRANASTGAAEPGMLHVCYWRSNNSGEMTASPSQTHAAWHSVPGTKGVVRSPRHTAVLLMELAASVALGWVHPRSSPQSSCGPWFVVKYSVSAASAPVMPVTPSAGTRGNARPQG